MNAPTSTFAFDPNLAKKETHQQVLKITLISITTVLMIAILGIQFYLVGAIRETQQSGSPLLKEVQEATKAIQGCTTPGESCYERGDDTATRAIVEVNRIITLTIVCADQTGSQSLPEISKCVTEQLEATPQ